MDKLVFSFTDVPLILVIFQSLLFAILLLTVNIGKCAANFFLAGFLLAIGLDAVDTLIYWSPSIKNVYFKDSTNIFYYVKFGVYLAAPMLFFYVKTVIHTDFRFSKKDLIHFTPLALFLVFILALFYNLSPEQRRLGVTDYTFLFNNPIFQLHLWMKNILYLSYGSFCFYMLHQYTEELKQRFSNIESIDILWLRMLVGGFLLLWAWFFVPYLLTVFNRLQWLSNTLGISGNIFSFIFVNTLVLYSIAKANIGRKAMVVKEPAEIKFVDKSDSFIVARINELMNEQQLFLDSELTLEQLADKASMSARKISMAINRSCKQNFYDYINSFRVQKAVEILVANGPHAYMQDVFMGAGFNSRATFYRAFKKSMNMSPAEYGEKIAKSLVIQPEH